MGILHNTKIINKKTLNDSLRINRNKGMIKFQAKLFRFRDKDTRQIVYYMPSLEVSGYGSTPEKAKEMLDFSLDKLFDHLIQLSQHQLEDELRQLGWSQVEYKKKEFSKSFIDGDGKLKEFNAVADEVEQLTLAS